MHLSIEFFYLFACRYFGSVTGRSKKCGDAHGSHLYSCSQRALWNKINLEFTGKQLPFKLCILTNVAAHHFFYLVCHKQLSQTKTINTGVVRNANKIFY